MVTAKGRPTRQENTNHMRTANSDFFEYKTGSRWTRKNSREKKALETLFSRYWNQPPRESPEDTIWYE